MSGRIIDLGSRPHDGRWPGCRVFANGPPRAEACFPGKKDSLTLLELVEGETAAIHALHNDGVTKKRIQSLGLFEGRRVCVIARAPFSGPLLVEDVVTGARVMIARDLAENIEVASDGANAD